MGKREFWVFGYGSLLWQPGFGFASSQVARLEGWHRSFCMHSVVYRGTRTAPGLVLALDRAEGAHCMGLGFAVGMSEAEQVRDYLRQRELVSSAYLETYLPIELADGRRVEALTFVINRDHAQYAQGLEPEAQAETITGATGSSGANRDYLFNTVAHLAELGLKDAELERLAERVRALCGPQ